MTTPCSYLIPAGVGILIPNAGNCLVSSLVKKHRNPWYTGLEKPNWHCDPICTTRIMQPCSISLLHSGMGYASYLVWKHGNGFTGPARIPLMFYGGQLALFYAWKAIFFRAHKLKLAFFELLAVDAAASATAYMFYKINTTAGYIFVPYLMCLGVATAFTFRVWRDNREDSVKITRQKKW